MSKKRERTLMTLTTIETNDERSDDIDKNSLSIATSIDRTSSAVGILARHSFFWARGSLERLPIRMTLSNLGVLAVILAIVLPRSITYILVYPIFRLVFGTLYPAYASYKAVRTQNVKEYVKWMMYWIVFALFTCAETFTDVFFSFWFPFYYEIKIILVLWLLSPATKGSSILYRRFVHPALTRREAKIDETLARATEQGYKAVLHLGTRGVNYATTVLMQTAIKGGGGLVQQLRKSYSLSDLTGEKEAENRNTPDARDETDMQVEPRRREHVGRRGYSPRRTQSSSNRVEMYFSEVDVDVRQPRPREPISSLTNIRSSDDISSGYSSGEAVQSHRATSQGDGLVRTSSVGARTRVKSSSTTKKTPEDAEEESECIYYPPIQNIPVPTPLSLITPDQAFQFLLHFTQNNNLIHNMRLEENIALIEDTHVTMEKCKIPSEELNIKDITDDIDVNENTKNDTTTSSLRNDDNSTEKHLDNNKLNVDGNKETAIDKNEDKSIKSCHKDTIDTDVQQITDELNQQKFNELKQLLDSAHTAVCNITFTQGESDKIEQIIVGATSQKDLHEQDVENKIKTNARRSLGSCESIDPVGPWTMPNVLRSNSDSTDRAGKYNKKPAPKVPTSSAENLENESQNALKATLVIKTGMVKTFSNLDKTKDVFIARTTDAKKKKSSKSRTKDGFSKLLTIPKNIYNAFHKDQREFSKEDFTSYVPSETSNDRSRSESIESQNISTKMTVTNQTDDNSPKTSTINIQTETPPAPAHSDGNHDSPEVGYINTEMEKCNIKEDTSEKVQNKDSDENIKSSLKIRQMSRSPSASRKNITNID